MRSQVLAGVLSAGLVAFATPVWSRGPDSSHGNNGGGHPSGSSHPSGGSHVSSGGHGSGGGHVSGGGHTGTASRGGYVGRPSGSGHGGYVGRPSGSGHGSGAVHTPRGTRNWGGGHPGWGGHQGWRGYRYRGGSFGWGWPFAWDAYWGWGWPYGWGAYWGWGWPFGWGASWGWPMAYYGNYGLGYDGPVYYESGGGGAAVSETTSVDIHVVPEAALVYLNGVLIGTADDFDGSPDGLYLKPGHYTLEFRLPGYRSRTWDVDAGEKEAIPIDLELARDRDGSAMESYRPPQGLPYGRVFGPDFGQAIYRHAAGPDPMLRPELRQRYRRGGDAGAAPVSAAPNPGLAALKLRISPPNAAVYLDGTFLGSGVELARLQRGMAVAPGAHTLEVLAPGRAAKSLQIEAEQGKELEVAVDLDLPK